MLKPFGQSRWWMWVCWGDIWNLKGKPFVTVSRLHPGELTRKPNINKLNRKMIWTKPPWLWVLAVIFQFVSRCIDYTTIWGKKNWELFPSTKQIQGTKASLVNHRIISPNIKLRGLSTTSVPISYCMGVSENSGTPQKIIHLNRVFHYKPSILGYHYFWKHPYVVYIRRIDLAEPHGFHQAPATSSHWAAPMQLPASRVWCTQIWRPKHGATPVKRLGKGGNVNFDLWTILSWM